VNKKQLRSAIYEAGLSREQLGSRGVKLRVKDGAYSMKFEKEHAEIDSMRDAITQLESWAEDAEIDFEEAPIVELTAALNRWFETTPYVTASGRDDFFERVERLVQEHGFTSCDALDTKGFDGEPLCYVAGDLNWCVYVNAANQVAYVEGTPREDERPREEEELPDG